MTAEEKRDRVLNAIHEMLVSLEIPSYTGWDIDVIGDIRDTLLDRIPENEAEALYPTEEFVD